MQTEREFEEVHNRASVARLIAIPVGLIAYGAAFVYGVFGWAFAGTLVMLVLTIVVPGALKRMPIRASVARSSWAQLSVEFLMLVAIWFVVRGHIHPHYVGWSAGLCWLITSGVNCT